MLFHFIVCRLELKLEYLQKERNSKDEQVQDLRTTNTRYMDAQDKHFTSLLCSKTNMIT